MNALWKAIGIGGSGVPNFEYNLGEISGTVTTPTLTWNLRRGTRVDDKSEVTIFEAKLQGADQASIELARNVQRRAKTLMVPGFLRCFDAVEHNEVVYVATEPCTPMEEILANRDLTYEDKEKWENAVALGVHTISTGLTALHKNNLVHSNVNLQSVYVLKSGEWRLFGHEFVEPFGEEHSLFRRYVNLVPEHRRPPELSQGSGAAVPVHATDAWGMAALLFEAFSGKINPNAKGADLKGCRSVPRTLQSGFTALAGSNPKLRMNLDKFIADTDFISSNDYVQDVLSLEELTIMNPAERDSYYHRLASHVDDFPLRTCKYVILSKLNIAVQYGGSSGSALEPILKIGSRLDEHDFATLVSPVVVSLFSSPDHAVRCRLLTSAQEYAKYLPGPLVCEKIWPHFVSGFTSKSADLRELTVRALVHFAPLLNETILTTDVMKSITALQQDREAAIRTNATIALGMIGERLPEGQRGKLLMNGFGRMLKDPFVPSRAAAVRCIGNHRSSFSSTEVATQLMPAVAPLTVDASHEVREAAIKTLQTLLGAVEEAHAARPAEDVTAAAPSLPSGSSDQDLSSSKNAASSKGWGWGWGGSSSAAPSGAAVAASEGSLSNSAEPSPRNEPRTPVEAQPVSEPKVSTFAKKEEPAPAPVAVQPVSRPKKLVKEDHADPAATSSAATVTTPARPGALKLGAKKKGLAGTKAE